MIGYKPIPELNKGVPMLFWSKVAFTGNVNECWNWTGTIRDKNKSYGRFRVTSTSTFSSHRIAYFLQNKIDPKEFHVLHKCDNPKCCNPNHLFLGTNADNVADKVKKGRQAVNIPWNKGMETKFRLWDNSNCPLTKDLLSEIKTEYENGGVTLSQLEKKYKTSKRLLAKGIRLLGGYVPSKITVLTKEQVLEIRDKYVPNTYSSSMLAKEYGVGGKTILDIVHRKTWVNI